MKKRPLVSDHPESLQAEAAMMPWKPTARFPLHEYTEVINTLRERGYSYAEIAAWLNEKLAERLNGTSISRGQVYHVHRFTLAKREEEFKEAYADGNFISVAAISDAEAESKAAELDNNAKTQKSAKKGKRK